jgi:hypothetical protein
MLNATDIDYPCAGYDVVSMKPRLLAPALALALAAASPVAAQCFADYKAKQDNPLRLHYGVAELPESGLRRASEPPQAISGRACTRRLDAPATSCPHSGPRTGSNRGERVQDSSILRY